MMGAPDHCYTIEFSTGAQLFVASAQHPAFARMLDAAEAELMYLELSGELTPTLAESIWRNLLATHWIQGWSGIRTTKGAEVPFSIESALKVLADPAVRRLVEPYKRGFTSTVRRMIGSRPQYPEPPPPVVLH